MCISLKDRVTNEEVRVRTGQHSIDDILSESRLRWLAWTCDMNGSPVHTLTGVALGGSGFQERSRSSAYKLDEEHSQQGLAKDGNHLGGSGGGSSKQMAPDCGPMHSLHLDAGAG